MELTSKRIDCSSQTNRSKAPIRLSNRGLRRKMCPRLTILRCADPRAPETRVREKRHPPCRCPLARYSRYSNHSLNFRSSPHSNPRFAEFLDIRCRSNPSHASSNSDPVPACCQHLFHLIGRWSCFHRSSPAPCHILRWSCCYIRRWPEHRFHFACSDNRGSNPGWKMNRCYYNPGCKLTL